MYTLYNYYGQFKVQRTMQDRIAFDERIQAAKELIDDCVAEWTQGSCPELLAIIDQAFTTDKAISTLAAYCSCAVMILPIHVGYAR